MFSPQGQRLESKEINNDMLFTIKHLHAKHHLTDSVKIRLDPEKVV